MWLFFMTSKKIEISFPDLFLAFVKDIHREKNTLKLNFTAYEKYEYEHLGRWYIKLTLFKRC